MDSRNFEHSSVEVHIEASSIETGLAPRDADLRSKNFLFAERFPQLVFKSKRVEKQDEKRFRLVGELTIRGNTREIVLDTQFGGRVKDPYGMSALHLRPRRLSTGKTTDLPGTRRWKPEE